MKYRSRRYVGGLINAVFVLVIASTALALLELSAAKCGEDQQKLLSGSYSQRMTAKAKLTIIPPHV
jgi:hypothetical protein